MGNTIVVGVDGSAASKRALDYALKLATDGQQLLLVHVIDWSPFVIETLDENEYRGAIRKQQLDRAQNEIVQPAVEQAKAAAASVEAEIVFGAPAEEIIRLAREHEAVLIAVGRTGTSKIQQLMFGSKASKLIQMTKVPIVVVP